jgi:ubiquinone/menaquinone biosynthesis C-methylase UbiE
MSSTDPHPTPNVGALQRAYRFWPLVYDAICGRIFCSTRREAAMIARRAGRRILEIGVGTGLSLSDYGQRCTVSGIDISPEMIAKARRRVAAEGLADSCDLRIMDAHALEFADEQFDVVVGQFVITLVADPERVLDEAFRVVSPGGELLLANHFLSDNPTIAKFEQAIAPAVHHIGLRPDFPFARVEQWVARQPHAVLHSVQTTGPLGSFSIVRIQKRLAPKTTV